MIASSRGTSSSSRAPAASSAGDLGIDPQARSTLSPMLQAIAAGLKRDAASQMAGWEDGRSGAPFQPRHFDAFSYACGFGAARHIKQGGHPCVAK